MTRTRNTTHPLAVPVVARDAEGAVAGAPPIAPGWGGGGSNPRQRRLPVYGAYHYTIHVSYAIKCKSVTELTRVFTLGHSATIPGSEGRLRG